MKNTKKIILLVASIFTGIVSVFIFNSCKKAENAEGSSTESGEPNLFDMQNYQGSVSGKKMFALGRVLFYDKKLSLNGKTSCGSCHKQQFGFADNVPFSTGFQQGLTLRNTSSIISWGNAKFWDGRAANFQEAVFMPVANHIEMGVFDLSIIKDRVNALPYYRQLFTDAFGSPEADLDEINTAISSFLSEFVSFNTKFDQQQLSDLETEGLEIFNNKGRCTDCHGGTISNWGNFTIYENIGLDYNYTDKGLGAITGKEEDNGKFNIPNLRNVALSAPYMHDGRFKTLEEVVDHYCDKMIDHPNLSLTFRDVPGTSWSSSPGSGVSGQPVNNGFPLSRISLDAHERNALVQFLKALTDTKLVTDPIYSDPFK